MPYSDNPIPQLSQRLLKLPSFFINTNLKGMELQVDMGMDSAIASAYHKVDTTVIPLHWLYKYLQTENKTLLQIQVFKFFEIYKILTALTFLIVNFFKP